MEQYFLSSQRLHSLPIFHPKSQRFPEPSVCVPGCCIFPLFEAPRFLVRFFSLGVLVCTDILKSKVVLNTVYFLISYRQEGWRLEHENPTDPQTPLVFKGIVFNEMKGAFVSPCCRLFLLMKMLKTANKFLKDMSLCYLQLSSPQGFCVLELYCIHMVPEALVFM